MVVYIYFYIFIVISFIRPTVVHSSSKRGPRVPITHVYPRPHARLNMEQSLPKMGDSPMHFWLSISGGQSSHSVPASLVYVVGLFQRWLFPLQV